MLSPRKLLPYNSASGNYLPAGGCSPATGEQHEKNDKGLTIVVRHSERGIE
jgi:hypothetical protein